MPPKNQGSIDVCLTTVFDRAKVRVQASALGKGKIVAVIVQNTFNNMDNTANNQEIMVGSATAQVYQMVPGQESPLIYATDLDQVWARVRDTAVGAGTPCDVTLIIYKEKEG